MSEQPHNEQRDALDRAVWEAAAEHYDDTIHVDRFAAHAIAAALWPFIEEARRDEQERIRREISERIIAEPRTGGDAAYNMGLESALAAVVGGQHTTEQEEAP